MKIFIWNVNGIRAIIKKNVNNDTLFLDYLNKINCDIICFNETKISKADMSKLNILQNYPYQYHAHSIIKKGYSGVSIYSKLSPLKSYEFPENDEGRVIGLEYDKFILINVYQPNSGNKLVRLDYRINNWSKIFQKYVNRLQKIKPVIIVGDLNVAASEIDIANPDKHLNSAGYTIDERNAFYNLLESSKLIDSWRYLHPNKIEYTYFDYRSKARKYNRGWRIDYCLVDKKIINYINTVTIQSNIIGSDHIPLIANLQF